MSLSNPAIPSALTWGDIIDWKDAKPAKLPVLSVPTWGDIIDPKNNKLERAQANKPQVKKANSWERWHAWK